MVWLLSTLFIAFSSTALESHFNGVMSAEEQVYADDLGEPTRTSDTILELQPELDLKYNKLSRMHFKPLLRSNISTDEKPEQLFLNVQEAYWEIRKHPYRLRIGENTYNWGVMDGYSTQDVVNGRVLYNPLSSERRGAPTVDLQYEGDFFQIQALYIPQQARTLLPSADSRWLPRDVLINSSATQDVTVLLPKTFDYYFPDYQDLDGALKNNFGVRLSAHYNSLDWTGLYFEGMSTIPQFSLIAAGNLVSINPQIVQATSNVGIIPIYYRQRTVGTSLVWAPEYLILKAEATYTSAISDDPQISPWGVQTGLGLERPWNLGSTTITSILQVYYGDNKVAPQNLVSSSGRLFDRAAILGARWSISDSQNLLLSYLYDYKGYSSYAHVGWDIKFIDKYKVEVYGDLIQGDPSTFLGTYRRNDRAGVRFSFLW